MFKLQNAVKIDSISILARRGLIPRYICCVCGVGGGEGPISGSLWYLVKHCRELTIG